ncbi:hypothetical protein DM02DRAFT_655559 [Periconia macrospinosa]|uniref:Uncharacterized protein n=1 Tax=Periconia macrospinosa TaxID=97972 RepID=A0A2V1DSX9_9PLEO|nr:hypothetical protein DM02DRAFT_655559 [Periconia macrospinosa]
MPARSNRSTRKKPFFRRLYNRLQRHASRVEEAGHALRDQWREKRGQPPYEPPPPYTEYAPEKEQEKTHLTKIQSSGGSRETQRILQLASKPASDRASLPWPTSTSPDCESLLRYAEYSTRESRANMLLGILLDIMVYTFRVDIPQLKNVLTTLRPSQNKTYFDAIGNANQLRSENDMKKSRELCQLVRYLFMARHQWAFVSELDKELARMYILEPVMDLDIDLRYVLEVLGMYIHPENPNVASTTLVDYWMEFAAVQTPLVKYWNRRRTEFHNTTCIEGTLASHVLLIRSLHLHPTLTHLLENAILRFKQENGLQDHDTSKEMPEDSLRSERTIYWPLRVDYIEFACKIRRLYTPSWSIE